MSDVLVSYDFPPMIGGAHSWVYELYRRWSTEVRVLTAEYSQEEAIATRQKNFDRMTHGALRISRRADTGQQIDLRSYRYLKSLWRQASEIGHLVETARDSEGGIDIIHALRAFPEGVAAWLYWRRNPKTRRLVTYVHGEEVLVSRTSRQLTLLARRVYRDSHLIIANSENTKKMLAAAYPGTQSVTIHPGVDVRRYHDVTGFPNDYRGACGWPKDTVVVLTLARMEPRKNHAAVIRAVANLRSEDIPVALVCGGDGPERHSLERLVRELNVSRWVHFAGAVSEDDKASLFLSADIFAMPSVSVGAMIEGFGIVFLEAAAAGLPTICGISGGQGEAVLNGTSGLAVDGESLEAVTGAIKRLACDRNLRREFGEAGRKWAAENDWELVGAKVRSSIRDMITSCGNF